MVGLPHKPFIAGNGGRERGITSVTLDGGQKSGFLTADERACAETDMNIEIKARAEDVVAENAVLSCLFDCDFKTCDRDGIFRTNVDLTLRQRLSRSLQ